MSENAKAVEKQRLAEALRANLRRRKAAPRLVTPAAQAASATATTPVGHAPDEGNKD